MAIFCTINECLKIIFNFDSITSITSIQLTLRCIDFFAAVNLDRAQFYYEKIYYCLLKYSQSTFVIKPFFENAKEEVDKLFIKQFIFVRIFFINTSLLYIYCVRDIPFELLLFILCRCKNILITIMHLSISIKKLE